MTRVCNSVYGCWAMCLVVAVFVCGRVTYQTLTVACQVKRWLYINGVAES